MTKTITKATLAQAAIAAGETKFIAPCKACGTMTLHSTNDTKCVPCKYERHKQWRATPEGREISNRSNRESNARALATPEGQARWEGYRRTFRAKLRQDPLRVEKVNARRRAYYAATPKTRGLTREATAAKDWRTKTGGNMHGWYELEREALQQLYGACREGFEIDHAVAKVTYGLIDGQRELVVVGTHSFANLVETPSVVNKEKRCQFDPGNNRLQRPANRGPGGAFDPKPTAWEFELIANAAYEGTPARVSLKALRDSLESQARAYEAHVEVIETELCTRYTNALALMLGYAGMIMFRAP